MGSANTASVLSLFDSLNVLVRSDIVPLQIQIGDKVYLHGFTF